MRSLWAQPFLNFFEGIGAPVEEYLEESALLSQLADHHDLVYPSRLVYRLIDRLARDTAVGDAGLKVGERTRIRDLGRFGRRVTSERSLDDAIQIAARWMASVHTERQISLSIEGRRARLSSRLSTTQLAPTLWEDQFVLLMLVDLVRMAAGPGFCPEAVSFQAAPPENQASCRALRGARIRYGENATMLEFPRSLLSQHLTPANQRPPVDMKILPRDLVGSFQLTLELLIPQGYTDIHNVASLIGTSSRTLQRQFSAHGTTFSQVLARSRLGLASRLLSDPAFKVIDVAYETGYSDPAHFTNAFRRWTGLAPRAYRSVHGSMPLGAVA
jgi:AraC-like DNA-binding protein